MGDAVDWNAIAQGALSAVLTSGVVVALFKSTIERRIDHHFNVQLKRYEAGLKVTTAAATKVAEARVDDYTAMVSLIRQISRKCRDVIEQGPEGAHDAQALVQQVDALQKLLYEKTMTLASDRLYDDVHYYKSEIRRISRQLIDAHQIGNAVETADRLKRIGRDAKEILAAGDQAAIRLEDAVRDTAAIG